MEPLERKTLPHQTVQHPITIAKLTALHFLVFAHLQSSDTTKHTVNLPPTFTADADFAPEDISVVKSALDGEQPGIVITPESSLEIWFVDITL